MNSIKTALSELLLVEINALSVPLLQKKIRERYKKEANSFVSQTDDSNAFSDQDKKYHIDFV